MKISLGKFGLKKLRLHYPFKKMTNTFKRVASCCLLFRNRLGLFNLRGGLWKTIFEIIHILLKKYPV